MLFGVLPPYRAGVVADPGWISAIRERTLDVGQADFETRLRVDEYSHVRVISELSNGELSDGELSNGEAVGPGIGGCVGERRAGQKRCARCELGAPEWRIHQRFPC